MVKEIFLVQGTLLWGPTLNPTSTPSSTPTVLTESPTQNPTISPTTPTNTPTVSPTTTPTAAPTNETKSPTTHPTGYPTTIPTQRPSLTPTFEPSKPTITPSYEPTFLPTNTPSISPTTGPTQVTVKTQGIWSSVDAKTFLVLIILGICVCTACIVVLCCILWMMVREQKFEYEIKNETTLPKVFSETSTQLTELEQTGEATTPGMNPIENRREEYKASMMTNLSFYIDNRSPSKPDSVLSDKKNKDSLLTETNHVTPQAIAQVDEESDGMFQSFSSMVTKK